MILKLLHIHSCWFYCQVKPQLSALDLNSIHPWGNLTLFYPLFQLDIYLLDLTFHRQAHLLSGMI